MSNNLGKGEYLKTKRIDERVKEFISDHFEIDEKTLEKLYHPSATEVYQDALRKKDGKYYLGSPLISSIRNPMAMRSLHQVRKVVNELIKEGTIDRETKINIEMARDLKNANERKALQQWQRLRETEREEYKKQLRKDIKAATGRDIEPGERDILKYQLWEEQNHICLYTGETIAVSEFIGDNPKYDIEHTIPRSLSLDNSQVNLTLCNNEFNRKIKRNKIPYELPNHSEILKRIEYWKEYIAEAQEGIERAVKKSRANSDNKVIKDKAIQQRHFLKYKLDYWKQKYRRFEMNDVPDGFKNSQLVDTGIITKYARLYLKTVFNNVYTVKGQTVSDFRKMWGIQPEYKKKERINHIHHCIDAITMACMTKESYEELAKAYHEWEGEERISVSDMPSVEKPWPTFSEDVKEVENEVLISHYTPDVLPKQTKKKLRKRGKIQYNVKGEIIYQSGDTVRGSLHQAGIYGAINKNGKIIYVKRRFLQYDARGTNGFKDIQQLSVIIDKSVKEKIIHQLHKFISEGKSFKEAINSPIWMNEEKGIRIKKVRCKTVVKNPLKWEKKNRDLSKKEYKHFVHVVNDSNYLMAIYEGKDKKGKIKRDFEIVNNLEAGSFYKYSVQKLLKEQGIEGVEGLVPRKKISGSIDLPLKSILKIGTMVILWENSPDEVWSISKNDIKRRLYKIIGLSNQRIIRKSGKVDEYATIVLRFHQEASPASKLKVEDGKFQIIEQFKAQRKMNHNQFNALVEGFDFTLSPIGRLTRKK